MVSHYLGQILLHLLLYFQSNSTTLCIKWDCKLLTLNMDVENVENRSRETHFVECKRCLIAMICIQHGRQQSPRLRDVMILSIEAHVEAQTKAYLLLILWKMQQVFQPSAFSLSFFFKGLHTNYVQEIKTQKAGKKEKV